MRKNETLYKDCTIQAIPGKGLKGRNDNVFEIEASIVAMVAVLSGR